MIINSYLNDTFQEYKGEFPLVLFSLGCNLSCPLCYNKAKLVDSKSFAGWDVLKVIDEQITPLNRSVVFLGGEPTIWDDLALACHKVKDMGLKVKIFTNGMKPEVIESLNRDKLVDAYSVDFKCLEDCESVIGLDLTDSEYLHRVNRTINNIILSGIQLEIRTTKWESIKDLEKLKEYVKSNYPNIPHLLQEDHLKNIGAL